MCYSLASLILVLGALGADVPAVVIDTKNAPAVQPEDLGVTAVGRTGGMAILAPGTDGQGVSAYMCYYDHAFIRDPWEVCEVDLDTRKVTWYNSGRKQGLWGWMLGADQRMYTYAGNTVSRFDPATRGFQHFGPASADGSNYSTHWGEDAKLYIGTYPNARVVQFDPGTGAFHDYGPMGPERKHPSYAYRITGDKEHIYVGRGKIPWYLIALDIRTGAQTELATVPQTGMINLTQRDDVCYATINREAYERGAGAVEHYRLQGAAMTRVEAIPPAKPDPKSPRRGITALDKWEVCRWSGYGEPDGMVEFWFRREGDEWQSVKYRCGGSPARIFSIRPLSDGRLAGSTDDPYSIFIADPATGKTTVLGKAPSHTYDLLWHDGKLYMSGYANAPLDVYDPAKPWTARSQRPEGFAPEPTSPQANPHRVADFNRAPFMQKWSPSMAAGADGRIYVACRADREKTGGTLGWYDPKTGESGGLEEPFRTQAVNQVLAALDGRYVVAATTFDEDPNDPKAGDRQAHVVAYDTRESKIVGDVTPVPEVGNQGSSLVEWRPGLVVGRVGDPRSKGTILYVLRVPEMKVERPVSVSASLGAPFKAGDALLALQGEYLVRIDPETWSFAAVAKLPQAPRRAAFAGGYVYLAMNDHLMRMPLK